MIEKKVNNLEFYEVDIQKLFKDNFSEEDYDSWLSRVHVYSIDKSEILLSVETNFIKEWISREYFSDKKRRVNSELKIVGKGIKTLLIEKFKVKSVDLIINKTEKQFTPDEDVSSQNNSVASCCDGIFSIGTELNKQFTFENYIVGDSNRLAYSVAQSIIDEDNDTYNPLFLYSEVGLGKTHLIQAICWELRKKYKNKRIVYLSAEKFMTLFVKSLKEQSIADFKEQFKYIDVLAIDDIQFLAGKKGTQNEFFSTFNMLLDENKRIFMACNKSLDNLDNVDEDLKSKIKSGIIVDIDIPDFNMRCKILKKKADIFGLECDQSIIEYIAKNNKSTCRDLEGSIKKLLIDTKFLHHTIDISNIKSVLKDYISDSDDVALTCSKLQKIVADFYKISIDGLLSSKRSKSLSYPRHILFYLCRELIALTWVKIAKENNKKNHATIMYE